MRQNFMQLQLASASSDSNDNILASSLVLVLSRRTIFSGTERTDRGKILPKISRTTVGCANFAMNLQQNNYR